MSEEYLGSREFFASITACLLAGDIKATVVENPDHRFVKIHLVSGGSFLWSVTDWSGEDGTWVYTAIGLGGELKTGATEWPLDTEVEEIAKRIALFDYQEALDFPMEHPADIELDLANS